MFGITRKGMVTLFKLPINEMTHDLPFHLLSFYSIPLFAIPFHFLINSQNGLSLEIISNTMDPAAENNSEKIPSLLTIIGPF